MKERKKERARTNSVGWVGSVSAFQQMGFYYTVSCLAMAAWHPSAWLAHATRYLPPRAARVIPPNKSPLLASAPSCRTAHIVGQVWSAQAGRTRGRHKRKGQTSYTQRYSGEKKKSWRSKCVPLFCANGWNEDV